MHDHAWYQDYVQEVTASYHDYIYPRPYPASSFYLYFDRKEYEVLGHELDISCGLVTVTLEDTQGSRVFIKVFVSQKADTVYCRTVNAAGEAVSVFQRMLLVPHRPDGGLPEYQVLNNGFSQVLPYNGYTGEVRPGVDKGFSVLYKVDGETEKAGLDTALHGVSNVTVQVTQGFVDHVEAVHQVNETSFEHAFQSACDVWKAYWECFCG